MKHREMYSQMITYHEVIFWITTLLCPAGSEYWSYVCFTKQKKELHFIYLRKYWIMADSTLGLCRFL